MIRLCVYDSKNKLVSALDSDLPEIVLGRALTCNVIVPDYEVQAVEARVIREADGSVRVLHGGSERALKGADSLKVGRHRVVITDLKHFAENDPPPTQKTMGGLLLATLSAVIVVVAFVDIFWSTVDPQFTDLLREISIVVALIFSLSTGFGVLSRLVNGEWRFVRLMCLSQMVVLGLMIALLDGFGLRWLLPDIFQYEILWTTVSLLPVFWVLRKMVLTALENTSQSVQNAAALFPLFVLAAAITVPHLPFQQNYLHPQIILRPPLPDFMETKGVTPDQAVAEIEKFLEAKK